jgi:parvulin-like peptidyl-prolyl isomerase
MMKKNKVESTYELDQVLRKQGRSLDSAKKEFMNDAVAHEFMGMKLSGKTYVSLVDMRRYYNTHLTEFDRPAQLTWREIRIPIEAGNKQAAEEKAKSVLQQVQANQDFATLAKTAGKGPTADQGGLWETSPGGFALQEINQALASLKPGQVAGPIGTEQAFHIVKLETSREAGPARFDEVQTDIQNKLRNEKLGEASMGFVKDLRKQAVVVTIFDSLPQMAMPGSDNQVQKTNTLNSPASPLAPSPAVVSPTLQQPSGTPSAQSVPQESAGGSSPSSGLHGKLGSPHASPVLSEYIPSTLAPA